MDVPWTSLKMYPGTPPPPSAPRPPPPPSPPPAVPGRSPVPPAGSPRRFPPPVPAAGNRGRAFPAVRLFPPPPDSRDPVHPRGGLGSLGGRGAFFSSSFSPRWRQFPPSAVRRPTGTDVGNVPSGVSSRRPPSVPAAGVRRPAVRRPRGRPARCAPTRRPAGGGILAARGARGGHVAPPACRIYSPGALHLASPPQRAECTPRPRTSPPPACRVYSASPPPRRTPRMD